MTENTSAGFATQPAGRQTFSAVEAATGAALEGAFACANTEDIERAMQLAATAYPVYKSIGKEKKSAFLRAIAQEIEALGDALIERASAESGLPLARLQGERGRTCGQLRMFADLVDEGSWVEAVIDTALPERQPLPRPDLRKMLVALGPVVVFGASNFPLAFSVAGGDTASALAAGCPVVVKAHSAHPGTSALVADAIIKAAKATAMPEGVFAILFDDGFTVGEALVKHDLTKAVTFTGSFKGGMTLHEIAQQRKQPIPVFAEMGSINPVIFLPGILESQPEELAKQYAASITIGVGQFCTNPGLLLAIRSEGLTRFEDALAAAISAVTPATMLTKGIKDNFKKLSDGMLNETGAELLVKGAQPADANQVSPIIIKTTAEEFLANPKFSHEVFGPYSLLVVADDLAQLEQILSASGGQLTVTLMAQETELSQYQPLIDKALAISGRLILNNVPTGVEVCGAMQHGGPFPSTSDSRFTSVGTSAIRRFVRPVSWQNWQQQLLPDELKEGNPLKIWRTVNQQFTKD